jgi:hypothetical protein
MAITGVTSDDCGFKESNGYNEYWGPGVPPPNSVGANAFIDGILQRDKEPFPQYIKSFEGLKCIYDWDRKYRWYEIYWKDEMYLQVETSVSVERFIELMVEFFTDAWDEPPVFLASDKNKKQIFNFMNNFPEFVEKIKGLEVNLTDD